MLIVVAVVVLYKLFFLRAKLSLNGASMDVRTSFVKTDESPRNSKRLLLLCGALEMIYVTKR